MIIDYNLVIKIMQISEEKNTYMPFSDFLNQRNILQTRNLLSKFK